MGNIGKDGEYRERYWAKGNIVPVSTATEKSQQSLIIHITYIIQRSQQ